MKAKNQGESRDRTLRDLWLKHGCPEKMTIHVRKTGETIILFNGLPVAQNAGNDRSSVTQKRELGVRQPVTLTCMLPACRREFSAQRINARFCSPSCRKKFDRERKVKRLQMEHERLLAVS